MLKDAHCLLEGHPIYSELGCFGTITIETLRRDVSKYELPSCVPESIQRSFDAARHAYIYSYFSYDLLTPGVSQLFACLELALKKRLGLSRDSSAKPRALFKLLNDAKTQGLITSDVSVVHQIRNVFQHGTECIIDPSFFLDTLQQVTQLLWELYDPNVNGRAVSS
jgi:hypothetical protein